MEAAPSAAVAASLPGEDTRTAPVWVKALVFLHLFCITVWALPTPPEAMRQGKARPVGSDHILMFNQNVLKPNPALQAYLFSTGCWQYWDMFAPNPVQTDFYGDAQITFRDGSTKRWQYPRMAILPINLKYPKERYRKFYERAHLEAYTYLWAPFAQRAALENFADPKNPPIKVELRRHWLPIAPPGKPQQREYNSFSYFSYAVDQAKLRRDAGLTAEGRAARGRA